MKNNSTELFPIIDEQGHTIGKATRKECHNGSKLLHPVIHLQIFNKYGNLYLQKRAMNKDIHRENGIRQSEDTLITVRVLKTLCFARLGKNWALRTSLRLFRFHISLNLR